MKTWKVDLSDEQLFGNEMAEDEEESLFSAYAYERSEFTSFIDSSAKLKVVRAYKGEGKSALLRWTFLRLKTFKNVIAHSAYASSLVPSALSTSEPLCVRLWKEAFIRVAAGALGARIDFKFSDDVVGLREEADRGGFAERGFVSAILARLKDIPGKPELAGLADPLQALRRVAGANDVQIWLVIDDLDENFRDTEEDGIRIATALVAMRQLSNEVKEVRFRTSIRPSTWAIIKRKFEALSKIEPYVVDLQWTKDELEGMLAARVKAFLRRNSGVAVASGKIDSLSPRQAVSIGFDDPMPWGKKEVEKAGADIEDSDKHRAPAVVIASLCRYRPRWMVELCKAAAKSAVKRRSDKIGLDDLTKNLEGFGRTRIDDLIAEFRAQCERIELIIHSFKGKSNIFKTDEIVRHLKNNVSGKDVRIAGLSGRPSETEIIRFLFQVGFITARRDFVGGDYRHYSFFDEPSLLADGASDLGVSWEIPSCFRQALQLSNQAGRMPR
ncbi:hypothetical protein IFT63_11365 [Stenotrophomonas sp. CFBP 13724]|uniref:P-loop ATPase, Sll1717 family n=1 Tax=Stenotrophomonas sp. CFBP 13724 TaxID=2775298 RepID=UPI0017803D45|nr:hypothetical protein [Stenotrophomonas sp. CFBP 13724]MBD8644182.1 hypothetical protein [Stenotrophomonas sp. CFBP 13724]